jgi:signal transduction histidine kinase
LKVIYRQSQRLLEQINQLLEAARIESGRLTFDPRNFSIPPVILDVIDSMEPLAREKNLELRFERPAEPVPDVYADPWRVEQVLINLLGNAIKYTEAGRVWVECGVCHDEPVPRLEIRVCDTGIGIEPEEQQRMFEEFWQANSARSKARSGLGLGMGITKRLVERGLPLPSGSPFGLKWSRSIPSLPEGEASRCGSWRKTRSSLMP